ncbi:DNA methyltransferase [Helicobacter cinaedi]|uniref:DNA methyltransferase n=1 Tax=Helicobacter cinaedi TaxID=213 RepID=UPI001F2E9550|nr:DNA methyltransferase [Helicobacter cinaedi]
MIDLSDSVKGYRQYKPREFSKIHQMTTYLAMFPPNLPYYFIEHFSKKGDRVYDPFSGRGTTAFEACRMGRVGIGNDLNPLAVCLTSAKVNLPKKSLVEKRLNELKLQYSNANIDIQDIHEDIAMLYEESLTLPQLVFLKTNLKKHNKIDNFILAILSGLMHGKHRKDGRSMYCSIDMPNTFSMSPNYVRNFIAKNNLCKIKQDVFSLLYTRLDSIFHQDTREFCNLSLYTKGQCFKSDALQCSQKIVKKYGQNSISLIITSPPYLKNINYGKYNWIRFWLLNEEVSKIDRSVSIYKKVQSIKGLKDNLNFEKYAQYMQNLFNSWYNILRDDAYAFVVIGDIDDKNLARDTWEYIQKRGGCKIKLIDILEDDFEQAQKKKVTRIWGKRGGKATKIDRILVLRKDK